MGKIKKIENVKVFCAILFRQEDILYEGLQRIENFFGKIDIKSEIFPFDFTLYYCKEMGQNLKKIFVSFERITTAENCADWKIFTNEIEEKLSTLQDRPSRQINIDPGYIELSKVVLLTTKNYSHRIYLGKGIYAEITLIWKNNAFQELAWTYPDYRTQTAKEFFARIRSILKSKQESP